MKVILEIMISHEKAKWDEIAQHFLLKMRKFEEKQEKYGFKNKRTEFLTQSLFFSEDV